MATRRIKEITNTATTFASDDFIALDGTTQGTRKMDKDDLIAEVSAGVSGDYLEEANNLSDVASKDTSKLNLEVPDVGTSPQEVPLNGMLGSMAYQSADSVSIGTLEVTDKVDGNLGINTTASSTHALDVLGSVNCSSAVYAADVVVNGTTPTVTLNDTDGDANAATAYVQFQQGGTGIGKVGDIASGRSAMMVTSDSGKDLMFFTNGQNASSATPAITVDTSQRVGIGTLSPSETLSVSSANTGRTGVSVSNTSTGGRTYILGSVGSATDGGAAAGSFTIRDGNASANRVTIDSSGNVTVTGGRLEAKPTSGTNTGLQSELRLYGHESVATRYASVGCVTTGGTDQNALGFFTSSGGTTTERVRIDEVAGDVEVLTGNVVIGTSGKGIDFGAVTTSAGDGTGTTGTVSNQVFSDYEFGSWVPTFATSGVDFTTMTVEVVAAQYVKVGRVVHCQAYLRTDNVDATGASGTVVVDGLPFLADATTDNFSTLNVGYSESWVNAPAAGYVQPNAPYVRLTRYSTTGASIITPSDLTAGASADKNVLIFSVSYIAST